MVSMTFTSGPTKEHVEERCYQAADQSALRDERTEVLLLTGPVGAGKTTIMFEASEILQRKDIAHAAIDFDALSWCYPQPANVPYGTKTGLRNLKLVWNEYHTNGIRRLILARVIESRNDLMDFSIAIPNSHIQVARVVASNSTMNSRLRVREIGSGAQWHIDRSAELTAHYDKIIIEDFCIDNNDRPLGDVATESLTKAGWIDI